MLKKIVYLIFAGLLFAGCNYQVAATPSSEDIATQVSQLLTTIPTNTVEPPTQTPLAPTLTPTQSMSPTPEFTNTPMITATPTISPEDPRSTLGDPTWSDDFETGKNFYLFTDNNIQVKDENGQLVLTALKPNGWNGWSLTYPKLYNSYLESTANLGNCSGLDRYGMLFRASYDTTTGNTNGYMFGLSCDGSYDLVKISDNTFSDVIKWTKSEAILTAPGKINRLGIMAKGNTISLYVNGNKLQEITDNSYDQGTFGFFIASENTQNFSVKFDEVAYWNIQ